MEFNVELFIKQYDPHPETVNYLRARVKAKAEGNTRASYGGSVEEARAERLEIARVYAGQVSFNGTLKEIIVPSPQVKDGIPVTVYNPQSCQGQSSPAILVYFHGGGSVTKCRQAYDTVCKILAEKAECIVLNVEYRLAPEHMFPANNDDAKCVTEWAHKNKEVLGGDEGSRLGVSGDSAGGRLAAVVCHETRNMIDFAILVYPTVTYLKEYPSVQEFQNGPCLTKRGLDWFASLYLREEDKVSPRASVILNTSFTNLPPTLLVVAEFDPLRDGCYEYYEKIKKAGVTCDLKLIKGVPHTFWGLPVAFKTTCVEAYTHFSDFVRKCGHQQ